MSALDDAIAKIDAALDALITNGQVTRIRDGNRETEVSKLSAAELRRRRDELIAQRDGLPARQKARRVIF